MISLSKVRKIQKHLFGKASGIVEKKGHDYNRKQQKSGDTLFNLRVARLLGIVERDTQSVLVRLSDKLMRLVSLEDPEVSARVSDERVEDTVVDLINYATYYYAFWLEQKKTSRRKSARSDG